MPRRAKPRKPSTGPFSGETPEQKRDRDWCLAYAEAVGRDSGLRAPINPEGLADCIRELLVVRAGAANIGGCGSCPHPTHVLPCRCGCVIVSTVVSRVTVERSR